MTVSTICLWSMRVKYLGDKCTIYSGVPSYTRILNIVTGKQSIINAIYVHLNFLNFTLPIRNIRILETMIEFLMSNHRILGSTNVNSFNLDGEMQNVINLT